MTRIRDATGSSVTLIDPGVEWLAGPRGRLAEASGGGPDGVAAAERIMAELTGEARASRRRVLAGMSFLVGLVLAAIAALAVSIAVEGRAAWADVVGSLAITAPAVAAMLAAGVVVPLLVARRRRMARACEVLLRHGLCPHCGHCLHGTPHRRSSNGASADSMGHTICPECGCAWTVATDGSGRSNR